MYKTVFSLLCLCGTMLLLLTGCIHFSDSTPMELTELGFSATGTPTLFQRSDGTTLQFTAGSRIALLNGRRLYLHDAAMVTPDGKLQLTELNVQKVLCPLLLQRPCLKKTIKRILLDPGHGGKELGAVGAKYQEKQLNLTLAFKLKKELEKRGFEVLLTRDTDMDLSLNARGEATGKTGADLFISIHHNAAGNKTATGLETYAVTPSGAASSNDEKNIYRYAVEGNRNDEANLHLAWAIQDAMLRVDPSGDRGVRFARFRVLVLAKCPAVLLEAGFISTPAEEQLIASEQRQQDMAIQIAEAIVRFNQACARQK